MFDDEAYQAEMIASPWTVVKCWYFIMKLQGLFLSGDYAAALAAGDAAAPLLWCSLAHIQEPEYWYYALALAAHVSPAAPVRQREALEVLARHEAKLAEWAASCPQNFGHKHALVSAEIARLEGRERDALQCYDRALKGRASTASCRTRRSPTSCWPASIATAGSRCWPRRTCTPRAPAT
ncbi:hypothetical protein [Nannocystis pusilla]|uniref:hypothetical protein n=1 Tax=Nannocystis pusilla TaxID=889268 RepID=UPI003B77EC6E